MERLVFDLNSRHTANQAAVSGNVESIVREEEAVHGGFLQGGPPRGLFFWRQRAHGLMSDDC